MTSRFSPEEIEEIKRLRKEEKWTYKQLIEKYSCGYSSLQEVIGIDKPRGKNKNHTKKLTEEQKKEIIKYQEKGIMCSQIAKIIDADYYRVRTFIKKNNTT